MYVTLCGDQAMLGEVTSRRQAVITLTFQVEQLLKQSSSELTAEQTGELETLTDDVRHRLNTVSTSGCYMSTSVKYTIYTTSPPLTNTHITDFLSQIH